MSQDNPFASDYSLQDSEIVKSRGLKLAEPPRFAKKYGSEKSYEPLSIELWEQLVHRGDVVCDVGAHHGIYSLVAAHSGKTEAVYAYEPAKENIAFLRNNARLNKLDKQITARSVALSNKVGEVRLQITEASDNANIKGHPNSPTIRTVKVKTSTLDADFANSKLDLIKIDTDGYEPYILDGAVKTFKNNPQLRMLIEINPKCLKRNGYEPLIFLERLKGLRFELFLIDDINNSVSQITNRMAVWPEIVSTPFFYNILCLPSKAGKHVKDFKRIVRKMLANQVIADARLDKFYSKTWRHLMKPTYKQSNRS
ncbi:MAG TPA: FkbM family methyltransferase [Candidatus Saccharimonadales bacterium]